MFSEDSRELEHISVFYPLFQVPESMKTTVTKEKERIQSALHSELGIRVDAPKQGYGSTNDGNTARIFFDNLEVVSRITSKNILRVRIGWFNH